MRSSGGIHLDNEARVACANAAHANVVVSIDMNGFGDRSAGGTETIDEAGRGVLTEENQGIARAVGSFVAGVASR